jgi:hypothetical protein
MPIDPRIALQVRPPEVQNPLDAFGKVLSLQHLVQSGRLSQEQLKHEQLTNREQERAVAAEGTLSELVKQSTKLDNKGAAVTDHGAVISGLAQKGFGKEALAYDVTRRAQEKAAREAAKAELDAESAALDLDLKKSKRLGEILAPVKDAASLRRAIGQALGHDIISAEQAQQYLAMPWDEQTQGRITQLRDQNLTVQQQLDEERKRADDARKAAEHEAKLPGERAKSRQEQLNLAAQTVSGVTDQPSYDAWLSTLDEGTQKFMGLPKEYGPAVTQRVRRMGMTVAQQTTADQQARPNTDAELAVIASDPGKTPAERKVAKDALAILEKHKIASRPVNQFIAPANAPDGPATIENVPEKMRGQVKAMIEYRTPMPPGGRSTPFNQELLYWANKVDPGYDASQFPARNKIRAAFTSGQEARNITSANTALAHLGTMYDSAEKLDNAAFRRFNTFANWLSVEAGKPTVKPFQLSRIAVSEELARLFKGGVATEGEAKQWEQAINSADSPAQLRESIKTVTELLASRVSALEDTYTRGMGKPPDKPLVSEKARKVLDKISGVPAGKIAVISPEGDDGFIDADKWDAAEKRGFKKR